MPLSTGLRSGTKPAQFLYKLQRGLQLNFDAGNYHLINIHKCLFIQCTAVARELYEDNSSAVCDRGGHELGCSSMKPEQVEVAVALIEGRDVFAILPTGFGKKPRRLINVRRKSGAIPLSL